MLDLEQQDKPNQPLAFEVKAKGAPTEADTPLVSREDRTVP